MRKRATLSDKIFWIEPKRMKQPQMKRVLVKDLQISLNRIIEEIHNTTETLAGDGWISKNKAVEIIKEEMGENFLW